MIESHRDDQRVSTHFPNTNSFVQSAGGLKAPKYIQSGEYSTDGGIDGVLHTAELVQFQRYRVRRLLQRRCAEPEREPQRRVEPVECEQRGSCRATGLE